MATPNKENLPLKTRESTRTEQQEPSGNVCISLRAASAQVHWLPSLEKFGDFIQLNRICIKVTGAKASFYIWAEYISCKEQQTMKTSTTPKFNVFTLIEDETKSVSLQLCLNG